MTDHPRLIRPADLARSRGLLDELFTEVSAAESSLSAGAKLGVGGEVLEALRTTSITFGNPVNDLTRLTPDIFAAVGAELSEIQLRQLTSGYDFYYATLTIDIRAPRDVRFSSLECQLDLGPKGQDEPIVQTIFPTAKWREIAALETEVSLSLSGDLSWKAGFAGTLPAAHIPVSTKADIQSQNTARALLVVPKLAFHLGYSQISAVGTGASTCYWRLESPELKQANTLQFCLVFKVPTGTADVSLEALCYARPHRTWLLRAVQRVWSSLSDRMRRVAGREPLPEEELILGDHEAWTLRLPKS